ncbi:PQQ-binding-like beta-propeller repeat protein [Halarchaeum sp. CBA1220]|uniref:outer membrane protein assembly factor BamB family protein n=1 Tax=Halarchaeum sp. CBA1220 TaxID=1853682 RepID=UPI000F3A9496|nr:PQQ-binding-like beta-propeller repeat protein [Halarchaeum sp. CBA1220]QLC33625.1 PQQ-binding-like beta-propeller repeat protein [Halarchaeum sp. CBA1220]
MSELTRRDALRAGGGALLAGLAGCSAPSSSTTNEESPTSTSASGGATDGIDAAWERALGGETALGPALADGTLYAGSADGTLHALDPETGEERWTTDAGAGFFGGTGGGGATPTVVGDTVYAVAGARTGVSGGDFRAAAFDATNGSETWSFTPDEHGFLTLLGVREGTAYAATSDDYLQNEGETLYALDAASGDVSWTAAVGDPSGWAFGAGGVYVESFSGVRAVSTDGGSPRWSASGGLTDGVRVAGDTLVAGFEPEDRPSLAGLDPATGDVRWRGPERRVPSYAAADGVVYAGGETAEAYDAATGERRWSAESRWGGLVTGPPVDGRLYVLSRGFLHVFDAATGERRWGTEVAVDSALVAGRSRVAYVSSAADGAVPSTLVVRDAATGDPVRSVTVDAGVGLTTPVVDGDAAFAATSDGHVYGFRT